ncbi:hypothetical protein BDR07DRAFT_1455728 [Suillus spraguei]|nr:hypothetical protein BDR07DRAFT_1455728 [Suillus spraguei]
MLFYLSLLAVLASLVMVGYRYRASLPTRVKAFFPSLNHYTPLASFSDQARAGLSSPMFDIESANIAEGDSRAGLDERERKSFDQARLIRHNQILARNGIDPSGMPLDSKAVTRL